MHRIFTRSDVYKRQYKNKDTNKDLLVSFGFGDGGGGPTRTQIKQAQMADRIPGLPHVKMEKPTDYFLSLIHIYWVRNA